MKRYLILFAASIVMLLQTSCVTSSKYSKGEMYEKMYQDIPSSILVMPPINMTTNIEAKNMLYSTLNHSIAEAGYYVVPPVLAMDVFNKEGVTHSELLINGSLKKFNEYFGADAALFTVIEQWGKLEATVITKVKYIIKSTTTDEIIFEKICTVQFNNTKIETGNFFEQLALAAVAFVDTALSSYFEPAEYANHIALGNLPAGKYNPRHKNDMDDKAVKYDAYKSVQD